MTVFFIPTTFNWSTGFGHTIRKLKGSYKMTQEMIFNLVGGLGLFFLGMKTMTESLKKVAGEKLKNTLGIITKKPIFGLLLGTAVTCLIQSSSATTVITVGFVNAGLLKLGQAISIILGANIGTTLTAWLVSFFALFKITNYALPAVGIGFLITTVGKTQKAKMWGMFILGFGLLFTGLGFIKDGFHPLKESEAVKSFLLTFGKHPLLGVFAGVFITILFQSSSATIAIVQVMAFSGLMDFNTAIPIILGDNIGTTITAKLAAIGAGRTARQSANAHALLNIIGVCYMLAPVYFGWYSKLIQWIIPGPITHANIMVHIAMAHTVFNVINSFVIFLPLIKVLEKLTVKLTLRKTEEIEEPTYLEPHLIETPSVAIAQAIKEIIRMMEKGYNNLNSSYESFFETNLNLRKKILKIEEILNNFQREIIGYLTRIFEKNLERPEAEKVPVLIHFVNDVERIGDHAINILELAEQRHEKRLGFSQEAEDDIRDLFFLCRRMFEETILAISKNSRTNAGEALRIEKKINKLQIDLRDKHILRLKAGLCDVNAGVVFIDFVDNVEKVGDHLSNIAIGVIKHLRWGSDIV